ncbi:hypothetical protein ACVGWN_00390, partial [Enterobacter hormaechei]
MARHPTPPGAIFFITTRPNLFLKFPPLLHPQASPPGLLNHALKKNNPHPTPVYYKKKTNHHKQKKNIYFVVYFLKIWGGGG